MPRVSFPALMIVLRRLSFLITGILAVLVYVGVYNATQSVEYATLAVAITLIVGLGSLISVMRSLKRQ